MDEIETINDRVRQAIEREGFTVGTFAKRVGVPDSTIRNITSTDRKPGYDLIVKIIQTIDRPWCDANWLVMGRKTQPAVEDQDTKKLLKLVTDQQRTIEEQRKRIDVLTDRLLSATGQTPEK